MPTYFALVKTRRGRTWYRADSSQSSDKTFYDKYVAGCATDYPALDWRVGSTTEELDYGYAPSNITRHWTEPGPPKAPCHGIY